MIKHVSIKQNNHRNKSGILQQFLSEAQKYKPLTYEQERTATREQLIKHNMLFASSIAFRYDNSQCDVMDLVSEAMIGLIKAADTFNPAFENKFISYALFHIQQNIKDFIDTKKTVVRYPHKLQQIRYAIANIQEPDTEALAKHFKVKERVIKSAQSIAGFVSLDDTNEDGDKLYQIASDDQCDKHVKQREIKELYNEVTECLTARELEVLKYRYFDSFPQELTQVGEKMNISRERVRQIQEQAFKKIRSKYARI
jgi:RNA polymerase primary sigma factor